MTRPHFEVYENEDGECVRLRLLGELDLASAPVLKYRLERLRAEQRSVPLDLSGLDFIDSSGIRLLISAFNDARADGWQLAVDACLSPHAAHSFRLAKLERLIAGRGSDGREPAADDPRGTPGSEGDSADANADRPRTVG
jgi:anti-sigma B factor antagonist